MHPARQRVRRLARVAKNDGLLIDVKFLGEILAQPGEELRRGVAAGAGVARRRGRNLAPPLRVEHVSLEVVDCLEVVRLNEVGVDVQDLADGREQPQDVLLFRVREPQLSRFPFRAVKHIRAQQHGPH